MQWLLDTLPAPYAPFAISYGGCCLCWANDDICMISTLAPTPQQLFMLRTVTYFVQHPNLMTADRIKSVRNVLSCTPGASALPAPAATTVDVEYTHAVAIGANMMMDKTTAAQLLQQTVHRFPYGDPYVTRHAAPQLVFLCAALRVVQIACDGLLNNTITPAKAGFLFEGALKLAPDELWLSSLVYTTPAARAIQALTRARNQEADLDGAMNALRVARRTQSSITLDAERHYDYAVTRRPEGLALELIQVYFPDQCSEILDVEHNYTLLAMDDVWDTWRTGSRA